MIFKVKFTLPKMNQIAKLLCAILIFAVSRSYAQCPPNIGFEDGTLANWEAYAGEIFMQTGVISVNSTMPINGRHTIEVANSNQVDKYGNFPTVSPNGSKYAVRLGNDATGRGAERLSYTLTVPAVQQYTLVLNYAVVFQNPSHGEQEQPRFTVTVFNLTDNREVECPAFNFFASSSLPGFKLSDVVVGGMTPAEVFYKDWSATTIDLSAYTGKQIRLEFTTNDCSRGGHFGYAYFDINENCQGPITGNIVCENQNSVKLQGPKGFAKYTWYRADNLDSIGNAQSLTLSPVPAIGTGFILKVGALPGLGCEGEFPTKIVRIGDPFIFVVKPLVYICPGTFFDLTSADVTAGSITGLAYEYYSDPVTQEYLRNPARITEPGIYYIRGTNAGGCTDILQVELKFYDQVDFTATDPPKVVYPTKVDLSTTFASSTGYTYYYFKDQALKQPVEDHRNVGVTGRYYIKAVTASGCEKLQYVNIVVDPPPPGTITGPTAFTPNSDGINDLFNVTIKGFIDFVTLSIYNRSGQFLFKTNSQSNNWDGNWNGKPLPAGTYYWLFEGKDQYYHSKVTKSGYVSIIK